METETKEDENDNLLPYRIPLIGRGIPKETYKEEREFLLLPKDKKCVRETKSFRRRII